MIAYHCPRTFHGQRVLKKQGVANICRRKHLPSNEMKAAPRISALAGLWAGKQAKAKQHCKLYLEPNPGT